MALVLASWTTLLVGFGAVHGFSRTRSQTQRWTPALHPGSFDRIRKLALFGPAEVGVKIATMHGWRGAEVSRPVSEKMRKSFEFGQPR